MLPVERQSIIISKLAESESVRTTELASTLAVTDETIRKDLEALEIRGELLSFVFGFRYYTSGR